MSNGPPKIGGKLATVRKITHPLAALIDHLEAPKEPNLIVKTTKIRGEDVRAGQFVAIDLESGGQRIYRVLRNDHDRRGGSGALQIMDSDKGKWWRGYQCYNSFKVIARAN